MADPNEVQLERRLLQDVQPGLEVAGPNVSGGGAEDHGWTQQGEEDCLHIEADMRCFEVGEVRAPNVVEGPGDPTGHNALSEERGGGDVLLGDDDDGDDDHWERLPWVDES